MLTEHAPDVFVEHVEAGSPSGSTIGIDVTKAGVRRGEYFDRTTFENAGPKYLFDRAGESEKRMINGSIEIDLVMGSSC